MKLFSKLYYSYEKRKKKSLRQNNETKETTTRRANCQNPLQIKRNGLILTKDGEKPDAFATVGEDFPRAQQLLTRSSNMNRRERMVGVRGGGGIKYLPGRECIAFSPRWAGRGGPKNFPRWIWSEQERLEKFQIRQTTRSAIVSHCRPITTRFL